MPAAEGMVVCAIHHALGVGRSLSLSVAVLALAATDAQPPSVKARYEKREVAIPMRDGVKLFTIIYSPRDTSRTYPFLMTRTGYGIPPYGDEYRAVLGPNAAFTDEGYIFVYQDTRGRFRSEGEFVHHAPYVKGRKVNESTDTYDTIEWLLKNVPNHNGRVGQYGISLAGWHASMGLIDAHPALRASSPQAPPQDQFLGDDYHSGGAFQLAYAFNWMSSNARARSAPSDAPAQRFDFGTPDGYRFFLELGAAANARSLFRDEVPTWNDYMTHGTYDEYWQSRNVPKDLTDVRTPVLIVAGWFDAEDHYGPFMMHQALVTKSPGNATRLVVGPWSHGGWARGTGESLGHITFGAKTSEHFRTAIELPFFNYYLKDKGADRARRGDDVRNRRQSLAHARRHGRRPMPRRRGCICARTAACRSRLPRTRKATHSTATSAIRKSPCPTPPRSRPPRARRSWSRINGSPRGVPTCWSMNPMCSPTMSPLPARSKRRVHVATHRHRWRLGGEADRCVSRECARSRPQPHGCTDGRLSDAPCRRHHARQVPPQLFHARAAGCRAR